MKKIGLYFICLCFINCAGMKKISTNNLKIAKSFDYEGHRGCRGLMPENTIPAMLKALDLGVTTLEMDISFTSDKKAILSHEPFFNHEITTKPDGTFIKEKDERTYNMYKMTYAETQGYDVGMKPHPRFPQQQKLKVSKPQLADLFDSVKVYMSKSTRNYPFFNIETKTQPKTDNIYHPAPEAFVDLLMSVIQEKKMEQYVIIQSFDFRTLQFLHKKYPTIHTAMLIEDFDKRSLSEQLQTLGFNPTIYSPAFILVDAEKIKLCRAKNIKVVPWTVNDTATIEKLKNLGVDGIISDYPNLFK